MDTIDSRWRLCTLISFIGVVFLVFFLGRGPDTAEYSTFPTTIPQPSNINVSEKPNIIGEFSTSPTTIPLPSNINVSEKPKIIGELSTFPPTIRPTMQSLNVSEKPNTIGEFPETIPPTMQPPLNVKVSKKPKEELFPPTSSLNVSEKPNLVEDERTKNDDNSCDVLDGKWVYDRKGSPLYSTARCPFLSDQVSCRRNGRPDTEYEKWSWEGNRCKIPRFNGTDMLERLRGKRVVIVGDSLNRNQWESLACLLYSSIHPSDAIVDTRSGERKLFRSKSYNCSVEFFWSPFLVQLEQSHRKSERVLRLDRLPNSARRWLGASVMIFNTGHWWVHQGQFKRWDLFQYKKERTGTMDIGLAYERAMSTWSNWVDRHINTTDTTVFFRSISPEHKGKDFCFNITQPALDGSYESKFPTRISKIAQKTIEAMKTPVTYLNITGLSGYRRDAHPVVYTVKQGKLLTEEQRKKPEIYADCSHWCLPGLPDTWNRLIYASMVMKSRGSSSSKPTMS